MKLVKANYNSYYDVINLFKKLINKFDDVPYYAYLAYNSKDKFNNFIDINCNLYFIYDNKNNIIGEGTITDLDSEYKLEFDVYEKKNIIYDNILILFLNECQNLNISNITIDISEKNLLMQSIILNNNGVFINKFYDIKDDNYILTYEFNLEHKKRLIKKNN